jgi:N12 class adenine-specific DNA methylase
MVLELLQDRPVVHEQLVSSNGLLSTVNRLAALLRELHLATIEQLRQHTPEAQQPQLSSQALELALQQLTEAYAGTGGRPGDVFARRGDAVYPPAPAAKLASRRKGPCSESYRPLLDLRETIRDEPLHPPPLLDAAQAPARPATEHAPQQQHTSASGEKAKARDILAAIGTLKHLEREHRHPTPDERQRLERFGGFGPVALSLFPDPLTGRYKDASWQSLGEELRHLLTPEEYESARRTTFNAFYTSPAVIHTMHQALARLGVRDNALVLEPGCGVGRFLAQATADKRFIGVELDQISGRIARALYPQHDIRIENFRDTRLPEGRIDAVVGNVPFANIKLAHRGQRFSLHDYFFAKSVDSLRPGGVLALVTSHFTLDKQNAAIREYLADQADFLGAIRLPAEAFKREGTKVVTDIVFLRKRAPGTPACHVDPEWLLTAPLAIEGTQVPVNRYFHNHPEMVLGSWSRENQLYGDAGFSVRGNGDLAEQLAAAICRLPQAEAPREIPAQPVKAEPFRRPPPERHIGEGSFFVGDDGVICQVHCGASEPVTHGSTVLRAGGTMMGRRLAALIRLRDAARLVLQSQNQGWPEAERVATRRALALIYDGFVSAYGPINKTTFSQTRDGTVIRRMPNLVRFREDPDAMLVMSLEDYDEVTGLARKAAIFGCDVVGRKAPVESVASAEEGLLVALDRSGGVDLPLIARLYGQPEEQIITQLGDLIFLDPQSRRWETADVYLSGNVREKLAIAEAAGPEFAHHAERLRAVQPPDVLPGDIDANLGAPWIPESDVQAFAAELFRVPPAAIRIGHLKKDAVWSVDADYAAEQSVAATSEFGTPRAGGIWLLELALNMKSPVIYDTIRTPEGEERVVNQEATLAAREKQKLIKEGFRRWTFADPDRTERLVRIYNDTYNNLRPRLFDGSHLEFPGMNQAICLRQHQKDAIWRMMSSGNTLLAHAVGAGKTFTMAAAGMKMKQAGLITKPMYVVPNHMLEQFAREFMQLYPNARLLVAGKEDMTRERRKFLTAKIASGQWDGIIVTHSSFERIGMSPEYQERFLREQIQEYDQLLADAASSDTSRQHRNLIKTIEKQKAAREARLKELLAEDRKDDGLVFDELGVDHIFIDEAHFFKNLETPTKMDRVAGIQTGGSQRAFDIYMKARYLDEQHRGHGVTFATGTPVSNTMVEMYNLQRFLDPRGLTDRGIEHFDAWAATFGEVIESMEISPDGASLRPRSRFARFNNLPELQQMFRSFADVQTAGMLDLPRPKLKTGKPITIACPMSEAQAAIQQQLIERYERLRSQKVDPREDNALAITTDGRKLALDARMLDAEAEDNPHSKVNALVKNVTEIWRETKLARGTQLIFCDMGVHPTAWGYSAYDDVAQKLNESGIPREQIAAIGDADSDAKKQVLFDKVRSGSVRVLLGSTQKMGTGTNVQKRLVALHHLDAPWKPAEVEQREGRILRQGNENREVAIYRYVTEGSFDAYMWQALETKARFIAQVMTGSSTARRAEDIGGQELSYAEVKAIASGNPAVLTLAEADAEIQRLGVLKKNHTDEQFLIRRKLKELPETIQRLTARKDNLERDQATLLAHQHNPIVVGDSAIHKDDVLGALGKALDELPPLVARMTELELGQFQGLRFGIRLHPYSAPEVYLQGSLTRSAPLSRDHQGPRAVLNALNRLGKTYTEQLATTETDLSLASQQLQDYEQRLGQPFASEAYLAKLTDLRDQLKSALSAHGSRDGRADADAAAPAAGDIARQIQDLQSSCAAEELSERTASPSAPAAEVPMTTRLLGQKLGDGVPNTIPDFENVCAASSKPAAEHASEQTEGDIAPMAHRSSSAAVSRITRVRTADHQLSLF